MYLFGRHSAESDSLLPAFGQADLRYDLKGGRLELLKHGQACGPKPRSGGRPVGRLREDGWRREGELFEGRKGGMAKVYDLQRFNLLGLGLFFLCWGKRGFWFREDVL